MPSRLAAQTSRPFKEGWLKPARNGMLLNFLWHKSALEYISMCKKVMKAGKSLHN